MQFALPVLGIVAAAVVTFYAVSFNEIREVSNIINYVIYITWWYLYQSYKVELWQKSLQDWDDSESDNGGFRPTSSSRERRARRQASKNTKKWLQQERELLYLNVMLSFISLILCLILYYISSKLYVLGWVTFSIVFFWCSLNSARVPFSIQKM